jgi:hypothetical protein
LPNQNPFTMKNSSIPTLFLLAFLLASAGLQAQSYLRMTSGQRLDKGQKIEVAGKGYLTQQTDGNLVFYTAANQPKWTTGTAGKTVTHCIMQPDGNLVIYNGTAVVWSSGTWNMGAAGGYLQIDFSNHKVAIYKANGTVAKVLQQGVGTPPPPPGPDPSPSPTPSGPTPVGGGK